MKIKLTNGKELEYDRNQQESFEKVRKIFKDEEGKPLELTPYQCTIFNLIWQKKYSRNHLMAFTRYGKSLTVAIAVLLRVATFAEKWSIVAPTKPKARIIMDYIIQHSFDCSYISNKLKLEKGESAEALRRKRNKDQLNYKHSDGTLGEVFIIGVDAVNSQRSGDSAMGFGAPNIVLDEAALVSNDIESKIHRMLGDKTENFYLKIGNPFKRNHFLKDYRNPKFHKVNVDYKIGLEEGRITQEFVNDAREKDNFEILYENKFPAADIVDKDGWSVLITDDELEGAFTDENIPMFGVKRLGYDVASGGGNYNSFTLRSENFAVLVRKDREKNLMTSVGNTIQLSKMLDIDPREIYIDAIGVGAGVVDRFIEQRIPVKSVKVSSKPLDSVNFYNLRAEAYWRVRDWIKNGGRIKRHSDWYQLTQIKYKVRDSSGSMIIMSKDEMRKRGIESPDVADSLMLTFAFPKSRAVQSQVRKQARKILNRKDKRGGYNLNMRGY